MTITFSQDKSSISGIIIEGISGSGKTSVLKEILRSPTYVERAALTSIVLSEHQTQRVLEKKDHLQSLTWRDSIDLLSEILSNLHGMHERILERGWENQGRAEHTVTFILERFHLTHVAQYPQVKWEMVKEIDAQAANVGGKLVLLTTNREELHKRLFQRRNPCWLKFLQRYGRTESEIVEAFLKEQEYMMDLCRSSVLPTLILDTTMTSPGEIAHQILEFWGAFSI